MSWVRFLPLHFLIQVENSTKVKRSYDFQAKEDGFIYFYFLFFIFYFFNFLYIAVFVCLESVS